MGLCYCRSVGWFRRRNDDFLFHDEHADDDDDEEEAGGGNDYGNLLCRPFLKLRLEFPLAMISTSENDEVGNCITRLRR